MTPPISPAAIDMIVNFEIGGVAEYIPRAQWPGGASGVTIGIGYDLGYETRDQIAADWAPHLAAADLAQLQWCAGVKASAARLALGRLRSILIPLSAALTVFHDGDVARYTNMTTTAFANCALLSQDSLGALVSLVFNRGTDTTKATPDRRLEMRQIAAAMVARNFAAVPGYILAMKRLWIGQGLDGLLARRDAEAALFEAGLGATVLPAAPTSSQTPAASSQLPASPIAENEADALDDEFNPGE